MKKTGEFIVHVIFFLLGLITVGCVLLISGYLVVSGIPAIREIGLWNFLFGKVWASTAAEPKFGILPFILTSVYGTAGAILLGVPVGFLTAVYLAKLAPPRMKSMMQSAVSLLAGIPSVVDGLVGMMVLGPGIRKVFHVPDGASLLAAIIVLAIMILPSIIKVTVTALEAVRNRMYANFERGVTTWLYIDEVQSLFGHPAIISYFSKFWAEGRKFNLICTGITQNSTYMLEHEDARNMVLNSDFVLLHKQSHLDRKSWVDLVALSAQEEGYIDDSIKAGEGLLVAGGVRVPLKDDFPKGALYDLFNTKPEEIAQIKRAQAFARAREGGDA